MKILGLASAGIGNIIQALPMVQSISKIKDVEKIDFGIRCNFPGMAEIIPWNCVEVESESFSNYDVLALSWWVRNLQVSTISENILRTISPRLSAIEFSEIECNMDVAVQLGYNGEIPKPELKSIDKELIDGDYIVIAPGYQKATTHANWKNKRWPRWKEFVELAKKNEHKIAVVGTEDENEDWFDEMIDYNLCGKTTIAEMASVLERAKGVVACDNGPAHIADAYGIPTVVMMSVGSLVKVGYVQAKRMFMPESVVPCRPCHPDLRKMSTCPDNKCMRLIEPKQVLSILENELEN